VFAFSIVFATGIGTGTLAGLAGGSVPQMLLHSHGVYLPADGIRLVLIGASLVAFLGIWPVSRLKLALPAKAERKKGPLFHPFLLRFLPPFRHLEHCHRLVHPVRSSFLSEATRDLASTCWFSLLCIPVRSILRGTPCASDLPQCRISSENYLRTTRRRCRCLCIGHQPQRIVCDRLVPCVHRGSIHRWTGLLWNADEPDT
jgi:hypothetical protein